MLLLFACAHHSAIADPPAPADSAELQSLFDADQADRQVRPPDWSVIGPRDRAREARVHEMLEAGVVVTALDYYNAAMIYQHAQGVEGSALAHELAMISAAMGYERARWLTAASWDRLLVRLDRGQRFGTQYTVDAAGTKTLEEIERGVTDAMRTAMHCPTLEEAEARETPR
jgi:hypothetical protein